MERTVQEVCIIKGNKNIKLHVKSHFRDKENILQSIKITSIIALQYS